VSAVGHEIDFTISDFAADVRAATPSAGAEIITEAMFASREWVEEAPARMAGRVQRRLELAGEAAGRATAALQRRHPRRRLQEQMQRTDDLQEMLLRRVRARLGAAAAAADQALRGLRRLRPAAQVERRREKLQPIGERLARGVRASLELRKRRLEALMARLRLLSPEAVLDRGYSITVEAATGRVLRDAASVQRGARIVSRLRSGQIASVVDSADPGDHAAR
jgi:exodeoxyribonuclease VII large subunit